MLDALCELGDGRKVNIEVQKADTDDHLRRVRYNGSILTTNIAATGTKFGEIPDVCVVYIMEFDYFKAGRPLYHREGRIRETGKEAPNGLTEIFVNAAARDGSAAAQLMDVFTRNEAYSTEFPVTSKLKHHYKNTNKGVEEMSESLKAIRQRDNQTLKQERDAMYAAVNQERDAMHAAVNQERDAMHAAVKQERDAVRQEREAMRREQEAVRREQEAVRREQEALREEFRLEREALRLEREAFERMKQA